MRFRLDILLLTWIGDLCVGLRLNPLENNDKLQSITNPYIAEWQWESWPIKQDINDNREVLSPGPRVNAALWKDNAGQNWYLFGGQPVDVESKKIYSDIWKYSVTARVWGRVFPSQDYKGKYTGKIGGMMTLRANIFDEEGGRKPPRQERNVVLCGRSSRKNATKIKKTVWSNFSRRKKEDGRSSLEESKSLAVYGPRTSKSNTVWQIDLKDKLWTAYVCCCDTSNGDGAPPESRKAAPRRNDTDINRRIDKLEDEMDVEQEHLTIGAPKKKKKINQVKKASEEARGNQSKAADKIQSELGHANNSKRINMSETLKNLSTETVLLLKNQSDITSIFKNDGGVKSARDVKNVLPVGRNASADDYALGDEPDVTERPKTPSKLTSKYCPDFTEEGEPVSWCDANGDALVTADLGSPQIVLWVFNLKTSHWSQKSVEVADDIRWPGCSNTTSIRYAGAGEEVYVICSAPESEGYAPEGNWTEAPRGAYDVDNSTKLVYRINAKRLTLESLGRIRLEKLFRLPDHQELWRNESALAFRVVRLSSKETILVLAYGDSVELWMLVKNETYGYVFEAVENIWRGSALKWFSKYNSATYNLQFVSESGAADTLLILNPRGIPHKEYWPRERGRFIIRLLKNENVKNHSFDNQTREHNLTYDLLQSDLNGRTGSDGPPYHSYNIKALIFFGICLAMFTIFGFVVFLKKCVNCPSRILMRGEGHKSPPVIRYSVIPEDLLYPVA